MNLKDIKKFADTIEGELIFDYDISKSNWFNIGGKTKIFFKPYSLKELVSFLKLYKKRKKIFLLGAGSNLLISDKLFEGVIIKLGKRFNNISQISNDTIIAGSNVLDKKLSEFAMQKEIGGLEFLSCIPGTVGGGIRMNSGCYNNEFKNVIISVQAVDYSGNLRTIPAHKIDFFYRGSNLPKELIFLSATFKGLEKRKSEIEKEVNRLKSIKNQTQPSKVKTGGSTFKNPIGKIDKKVWQLIKESVPSNISFGDASISPNHYNFFVNKNNAKFSDMKRLILYVKERVKEKFDIDLELEIVILE